MQRDRSSRILAEGIRVSNDTWETGLNNNTLIIGPSGVGKTRGYVIPNILSSENSLIVTDTKGTLYDELGVDLLANGYSLLNVDFTDCAASPNGYNPLDYVRMENDRPNEQDIMSVAAALCPIEDHTQPFWELAARGVMNALIGYTMTYLPTNEHNLTTVGRLFDTIADGRFEKLVDEIAMTEPDAFVVKQYTAMKVSKDADKMTASIYGILGEKLAPYRFNGIERMFGVDGRVRFCDLRREKTALFLNVSDTDRSMDWLVALFYAQAMRELINTKEAPGEPFLPVHIIMDDFAAGCKVENFDRLSSVVRSRGIYLSVIIQSIAQLESLYGNAAATITDNFDTLLYLGGNDPRTASYIGNRANRPAHAILSMNLKDAMLFQRGHACRHVKKYKLEDHPQIQM